MPIPEKPGWLAGRRSVTVVVTVAQRAHGQPEQPRNLQRAAERRAGGPCAVPAVAPSVRPAGAAGRPGRQPCARSLRGAANRTCPAPPPLPSPFPSPRNAAAARSALSPRGTAGRAAGRAGTAEVARCLHTRGAEPARAEGTGRELGSGSPPVRPAALRCAAVNPALPRTVEPPAAAWAHGAPCPDQAAPAVGAAPGCGAPRCVCPWPRLHRVPPRRGRARSPRGAAPHRSTAPAFPPPRPAALRQPWPRQAPSPGVGGRQQNHSLDVPGFGFFFFFLL